ncbi:MAG: hypothetical protein AAB446_02920 [Patescibacteria group bacterium]
MEGKTLNALHWIVDILTKHNVPYRIGGGFAAHIYGANRPINDIDITFPGKYFPDILPEISDYITYELKHYSDEKWDCDGLTLEYEGQEIDITDIDTLRMSNKEETEWFQTKDKFRNFPSVSVNVDGTDVSFIDPRDLVAYKKELNGEHQLIDIEAVQRYIVNKGIQL